MLQKYFMKNNFTFQPRESLSFCILKDLFLFLSVCVCVCVCVYTCVCTWVQVPMEPRGINLPAAGVTDSCELPDVGAENQTQVICKSHTHTLSHWGISPASVV